MKLKLKLLGLFIIWQFLGNKIGTIRDYLNNNNIPTAGQIRYNKTTFWENKAIKNILQNKAYIGITIQNKRSRVSYKNRKLRANPETQWQIVENTHEPIVDKNIFYRVQKMQIVQKYDRNEKKNHFLLDGLLVCYECKHKIGVRTRKDGRLDMICNNYRRNSRLKLCTSHGFSYERLEKQILDYIRKLFTDIDNKKIELSIKNNKEKYDYKKILNKIEKEIELINNNIDKMYIDKLNNKLSEEMYERLFNKLKKDIDDKEKEYIELKKEADKGTDDNDTEIAKVVKEFLRLEKPTPEMLRVLINRIEIHQDKQVDLVFNFKKLNNFFDNNCLL